MLLFISIITVVVAMIAWPIGFIYSLVSAHKDNKRVENMLDTSSSHDWTKDIL